MGAGGGGSQELEPFKRLPKEEVLQAIFVGNVLVPVKRSWKVVLTFFNGRFCRPWSAPEPGRSNGGKLVSLVACDQWDEKSENCLLQCWGEWAVNAVPTANLVRTLGLGEVMR